MLLCVCFLLQGPSNGSLWLGPPRRISLLQNQRLEPPKTPAAKNSRCRPLKGAGLEGTNLTFARYFSSAGAENGGGGPFSSPPMDLFL